jgi:anti-sigma factor ChrR (cupin superfamily)
VILWSEWHPAVPFWRTPTRLERLAAFIDGTLERVEHRRVSEHVRTCEPCLRLLREARALLAAEDAGGQV